MLISRTDLGHRSRLRFTWWRMVVWVLLLLAAFGCLIQIRHAQQLWGVLQTLPAGDQDIPALHVMLAWDIGYFVAGFAVIVACAGTILRQAWARPVLRAFALILSVWLAYRGVLSWQQWRALGEAGNALPAGQVGPEQVAELAYLQHLALIGAGIGALGVLVLLWLAWQLGQPAVRLQFRARSF